MFRTVEVRTRFIDSRPARNVSCALRGPSTERDASDELGSQRIYAINLLNGLFASNFDNILCLLQYIENYLVNPFTEMFTEIQIR